MKLVITPLARLTFFEEQDYIVQKWNKTEVYKFIDLVQSHIELLVQGKIIGKNVGYGNLKRWGISKQTSLFYRINESDTVFTNTLFRNIQKSPNTLKSILNRR